ncbi:MAG: TIGR02221 family CRISPR-associated protein [Paludibacteraceae bacterium]|nr:TIGR02221 family CRISPR-associated protein [Paludibacteraceae bacterium]
MARKVFISVLGTGFYGKCKYTRGEYNSVKASETRFIQQSTLEYLNVYDWSKNDAAIFLLTSKAKSQNWNREIKSRVNFSTKEEEEYLGLEYVLEQMNLPVEIRPVDIVDGKDEDEMWEIFNTLFNELKDGDELYFDLTHSFRYIPMLVLVLGNYSKFLKNVTIKSITYGNYEAREDNNAPIVDLLPLSALQDWTYAAGQFLENGNVSRLQHLCNEELKPILREAKGSDLEATNLKKFINTLADVIDERVTCRGMSIIKSESFRKMKNVSDKLETTKIEPLNPVFDKIKKSMVSFDENENIKNGFSAAVWCFKNGLLQQSATILQEFVITFVCSRHGIQIDDEGKRDWVTSAFAIKCNNLAEKDWRLNKEPEVAEIQKERIKQILADDLFASRDFVNAFVSLSEVRNDYNHSGMRSVRKPMSTNNIKNNIEKCINIFGVMLFNVKPI